MLISILIVVVAIALAALAFEALYHFICLALFWSLPFGCAIAATMLARQLAPEDSSAPFWAFVATAILARIGLGVLSTLLSEFAKSERGPTPVPR